jgi:nucleoside-diphosphate-sugar epimerase
MTRILITGGSGFIGTNLVDYYRQRGDHIINIDIKSPRNKIHVKYWRNIDILDEKALLREIVKFDPEIVFHLAARTDLDGKFIKDYRVNTDGVSNVVHALDALHNLRLAVFASSMLVCRIGYMPKNELDYAPSTPYGESKVEGERIVRSVGEQKFSWIIVRLTSIWGPWFQTPYRDFFLTVQRGHYFHPSGVNVRRSYGFVLNSVYQLDRLTSTKGAVLVGTTIYLADPEPTDLRIWADMIQGVFNGRSIRDIPLWVFWLAAKCGDVLKFIGFNNPPMTSFRLNNMLCEMIHDTTPLQSICGKLPYSTKEGVEITCNWLRTIHN